MSKRSVESKRYRRPAEWEPQDAVWVCQPHNEDTWPGCLAQAKQQFAYFLDMLQQVVQVRSTQQLGIATDDSWIRDYGPIFVTDGQDSLACHDFLFNCWGGKYELYHHDNAAAKAIALALGVPAHSHQFVLEGGSIDVNGAGTVMTTEQCLLFSQRNRGCSRAEVEHQLHVALGTSHVIWLRDGILGDDTDGHVDDIARFINPTTVLAVRAGVEHHDHERLEENHRILSQSRDQDGQQLTVIDLPAPDPIHYDYPADAHGPGGKRLLPASYANFLISNQSVFVPTFGQPSDEQALKSIEQAMPGYRVVDVRSEHLVVGLGAIHCLTQQQPRVLGRSIRQ